MTRKLKALGLAMVAVLAMSAIASSAAQANEGAKFTAAEYPAFLDASGTSEVLDSYGGSVTCKKAFFLDGELTAASSTLTVTPKYEECSAFGVLPATVTVNGCDYKFNIGATIAPLGTGRYGGTVDVECPEGQSITIDVWASKAAHEGGTAAPICQVHIPTQTGLTGIVFQNTAGSPGDVTISGTVSGVKSTQTRNSFLCPAGTSEANGKLTIINPVTALATNGSGVPIASDIG